MAATQEPMASTTKGGASWWMERVEIDTSAPFVSVKLAVDHFGGKGHWKQQLQAHEQKSVDPSSMTIMEEQISQLAKELTTKKQETLEVLEELEMTKVALKCLEKELQIVGISENADHDDEARNADNTSQETVLSLQPYPILMELNDAKLNLGRIVDDLASMQLSIDDLNSELQKEKISLQETRQRLAANSAKIFSLEKELNQTKLRLQEIKDAEVIGVKCSPYAVEFNSVEKVVMNKIYSSSPEVDIISKFETETSQIGEAAKEDVEQQKCESMATDEAICNTDGLHHFPSVDHDNCDTNFKRASPHVLSIGQILQRKLLGPYEFEVWNNGSLIDGQTVTLGQFLGKRRGSLFSKCEKDVSRRRSHTRRRKFGFGELSSLLAKHHKNGHRKKRRREIVTQIAISQ